MILIIDNYDNVSYNLAQIVGQIKDDVLVKRISELAVDEIKLMKPTHIIISSGSESIQNITPYKSIINEFKDSIPILGIGMAHQIIAKTFGSTTRQGKKSVHGKQSNIHIANGSRIFQDLPPSIEVARYHSFVLDKEKLDDDFFIIAEDEDEEIMAIKHGKYEIYGVQFNPESILTPKGNLIIKNFLSIGGDIYD